MSAVQSEEHEIGLISHLEELRNRLLVIVAVLIAGSIIGWFVFPQAYHLVAASLLDVVTSHQGLVYTSHPGEAFFTQCKLSIVIGLVLASPVVIWQLWAFVKPGLTRQERKSIAPLMPAISMLFIAGIVLAYYMLPTIMRFFVGYVPPGVSPNVAFDNSINFPIKIMVAFGLAFQLPVVLLGLIALHVISPQLLLKQWRAAIVVMAIIAAVVTPTGDPFNWSLVMVPLLVLYFGTVLLAFWLERPSRKAKTAAKRKSDK